MVGTLETGVPLMSELTEVLLMALLALPLASAVAGGIPGAWWPDSRRPWFALFACGFCGVASVAILAGSFWLGRPVAASIAAGRWLDFQAGSTLQVPLDFSLGPAPALFVLAIAVGGAAMALRLPKCATTHFSASQRTAVLMASVSLAIGSVLATDVVVRAGFLVIASVACPRVIGDHPTGLHATGPGSASSGDVPMAQILADVALFLTVAVLAAMGGSTLWPLDGSPPLTGGWWSESNSDGEMEASRMEPAIARSAVGMALLMAVAVRLRLFPFVLATPRGADRRTSVEAADLAIIVPASLAFQYSGWPFLAESRISRWTLFALAGATVLIAAWHWVRSGRRHRPLAFSAFSAVIAVAFAVGDAIVAMAGAALLAIQSAIAPMLLIEYFGQRLSTQSSFPQNRTTIEGSAGLAGRIVTGDCKPRDAEGPVALFLGTAGDAATALGRIVEQFGRAAARRSLDFCELILEEVENNSGRFYVAAAFLSTTILAAVVAWR